MERSHHFQNYWRQMNLSSKLCQAKDWKLSPFSGKVIVGAHSYENSENWKTKTETTSCLWRCIDQSFRVFTVKKWAIESEFSKFSARKNRKMSRESGWRIFPALSLEQSIIVIEVSLESMKVFPCYLSSFVNYSWIHISQHKCNCLLIFLYIFDYQ